MTERTAAEIRVYCETATEGPWTKNERWYGDIYSPVHGDLGRMYHANNHDFVVNARTDLPRALEAATTFWKARYVDRKMMLVQTAARLAESDDMEFSEDEIRRLVLEDHLLSQFAWLEDTDGST